MGETPTDERGPWAQEGTDLARALSGGLLVGVPLVYTNEVWALGESTDPSRSLLVLGVTFLLLVVLNRTSGFRNESDRLPAAVVDAVVGLAVGVAIAGTLMVVIGRVALGMPLPAVLATISYESVPCSLGVGIARHIFRERGGDEEAGSWEDSGHPHARRREGALTGTLLDLGAVALGAVVVALSIAPTQEVLEVAAAMTPARLLLLVVVSLLASYGIVFVAGFSDQEHRRNHVGVLQRPVSETVAAYLVSLVVAAAMLFFFEVADADTPRDELLTMVMALGLPACIGGAAGRLAA